MTELATTSRAARSLDFDPGPPPPLGVRIRAGEVEAPARSIELPPPGQPMRVARTLLEQFFTEDNCPTLVYWRGEWWQYTGTHWASADELWLRGKLYPILEAAYYINGKGEAASWNPTPATVSNVIDPLKSLCNALLDDTTSGPTWISPGGKYPAGEYVPVANGLLHLGDRTVTTHTPALFITYCLPFAYDQTATATTWERFLNEVFDHDPAGATLLQEWAGYLVSGRTDLHKALLLVGPPRAGKGVISRTLKTLVGTENTHSPSLRDFGSEFGLASLIGKPLAIVEDARGDDDRRNHALAERLLGITGEDQVSINRKNRDYWSGTLPTRIVVVSNEVPRFLDASGAVASRFMAVGLESSYLGQEDPTLGSRIHAELAGVLNWALHGLDQLTERGQFTSPETMGELVEQMRDTAAPTRMFIDERYTVTGDPDHLVELAEVHREFKGWCIEQDLRPPSQNEFSRRLNASGGGIRVSNIDVPGASARTDGKRSKRRYVRGITR